MPIKTYIPSYNGERSYKVIIDGNVVYINRLYTDDNEKITGEEPLLKVHAKRVFVGTSAIEKNIYVDYTGLRYDGNTILLQLNNNKYIYVCSTIYSFTSKNTIIEYVSPISNNEVPCPYAMDVDGRMYLVENRKILLNENVSDIIKSHYNNPYNYLWWHSEKNLTPPPIVVDMDNIELID